MKVSSIVGYEGKYDITINGDIISLNYNNTGKQQKLKHRLNKKGRPYINLCINGKYKSYEIHRLVAEAFIPKIEGKEQVNHIDGNKQNNSIKNLEWVTRDENMQHASINGLLPTEFRNAKCKLSNKQVEEIRKTYLPNHKIDFEASWVLNDTLWLMGSYLLENHDKETTFKIMDDVFKIVFKN